MKFKLMPHKAQLYAAGALHHIVIRRFSKSGYPVMNASSAAANMLVGRGRLDPEARRFANELPEIK
jgi:hypothetical protein